MHCIFSIRLPSRPLDGDAILLEQAFDPVPGVALDLNDTMPVLQAKGPARTAFLLELAAEIFEFRPRQAPRLVTKL